jgi:hypothetical protein
MMLSEQMVLGANWLDRLPGNDSSPTKGSPVPI